MLPLESLKPIIIPQIASIYQYYLKLPSLLDRELSGHAPNIVTLTVLFSAILFNLRGIQILLLDLLVHTFSLFSTDPSESCRKSFFHNYCAEHPRKDGKFFSFYY